jgi:nitroimidazol reductase NimA-like FMN-containing flavoprotein (pyridoxamine 5'-phosphate oxidase superfamily)
MKGQLDCEYRSVYVEGLARIVADREEKRKAYSLLMSKFEGDPSFKEVPDACLDGSVIVSIDICRITGKEHRPTPGTVHPET